MERGKATAGGRGAKSKAPQHPQDIFALGSKSTVVVSRDADKRAVHKPSTSASSERKRDAGGATGSSTSGPGGAPGGKRARIGSPASGECASGATSVSASLEVDPVELVPSVLHALDTHNSDKLLGLLTGAIRLLRSQRSRPEPALCMALLYLAKLRPNMFAHEAVAGSVCALLRRDASSAYKSKAGPQPPAAIVACSVLYAAHRDSAAWPETLLRAYLDDALNERAWVDCCWCRCLVDNVATAFGTRAPPHHLLPADCAIVGGVSSVGAGTMSPVGAGSPLRPQADEDADNTDFEYTVFPRYSSGREAVEALVLEAIKEQLQRRAAPDAIGKGFLKLLSATCGFPEIRVIAASRLEAWLHSGKLWRPAQELLAHVCCNVEANARDHEVLAQLARMRLKTKPLLGAYVACLREMVADNGALLRGVVTHTVYNELSNVRSPNNMAVLAALMHAQPQAVPHAMADTYHELLLRPEEYLRPLRTLTRECVRAAAARPDASGTVAAAAALVPLARALADRPPHDPPTAPNEVRERAFASLADLLCLCCVLSASHARHLPDYKHQVCCIQGAAAGWLLETAHALYKPSRHDFQHALHKILFLEPAEAYSKADNWPPESERAALHRLCCEVPLPQNTLLRIIFVGLSKELPVSPGEAFELLEQVVRRACALPPDENPLPVDKAELPDYIFQLCQYHHPDNISLPPGYTAPALAITSLYWRAWLVLLMLAAHNPHTFAEHAYHKFPTLKALIEMCITNKFSAEAVPAPAGSDCEAERAAILQLETHLAAASNAKLPITEHTSRLLSQLTAMEPTGPARRPPAAVCEALQQLSGALRLGRLLCRQPALLLDVVERHGTRRAMPWLHRLLQQSQLELSVLPVQCLCEFLAAGGAGEAGDKAPELAAHLRRTLHDSEEGARAVLHYYMQRLAHHHAAVRAHANRGLKLVLSPSVAEDSTEFDWNAVVGPDEWLGLLTETRQWAAVREEALCRVRAACLVECSPAQLAAYVAWLARRVQAGERAQLADLALDLSQVLMERVSVVSSALPPAELREPSAPQDAPRDATLDQQRTLHALTIIFYTYVQEARATSTEASASEASEGAASGAGEWGAAPERVELQWPDGHRCTMHVLIAHAAVKLLCYGPSTYDSGGEMYAWLVSVWVGRLAPAAFLPGSTEEALLLPDWLRLHLVRSARLPLVEAGLRGLGAHKLALFIQTFGMPVSSISALLAALDACPAGAVLRLAVERPYMAQLLRVQHARGATGGQAFAATLRLAEPQYPPDEALFAPKTLPPESESAWTCAERGSGSGSGCSDGLRHEHVAPLLDAAFLGARSFPSAPPFDAALARLQAAISDELAVEGGPCPFTERTLTYLTAATATEGAATRLARGLAAHTPHAIPLLRCVASARGVARQQLARACGALLHWCEGCGPLSAALRAAATTPPPGAPAALTDQATLSRDHLVAALEGSTSRSLQRVGANLIATQHPRHVLDAVCQLLERGQRGVYEPPSVKREPSEDVRTTPAPAHVLSRGGRGAGLLIDWLSELQPDTLGPAPHAQMRLMFRSGAAPWRPQLVTLLAHRGSWRTLHACLGALLRPEPSSEDARWAPAAVLDLASALARSPRLCRREHAAPSHDALRLSHEQLRVLVGYAVEEARAADAGEPMRRRIEARLPLMLQCCADDAALLCVALAALEAATARNDTAPRLLLLLLYMKAPKILKLLRESTPREDASAGPLPASATDAVAARATCATDRASHALLTALAADTAHCHGKDATKRMWRTECGLRALWARHWRSAERALPLLAALARGLPARAPALSHLLAAVELVPDHALFDDTNQKELRAIFECYLSVARQLQTGGGGGGGGGKDSALVHRTAALLRRYAAARPHAAAAFLHAHRDTLTSVPALSSLSAAGGEWTAPASSLPPPRALAALQRRDAPTELQWALQELEAWGVRRGGAWGGARVARSLVAAAAPFVYEPSASAPVRQAALSLLCKAAAAAEGTRAASDAALAALESGHADVAAAALHKLPELVAAMPEQAPRLLLRAFEAGAASHLSVETALGRCVAALNTHRGC